MEGANEAARARRQRDPRSAAASPRHVPIWPLTELDQFRAAKALDAWLYKHGKQHAFEILGIRNAARAGNWLRRLEVAAGFAKIDDWVDGRFRLSRVVKSILAFLGLG